MNGLKNEQNPQRTEAMVPLAHTPEAPVHPAVIPPYNPSMRSAIAAGIFFPAITLMNRLDIPRKFALLGLMSLIAIVVVIYSLYASLDRVIRTSQRELEGIVLIKPLSRTMQLIQQHRGISSGVLGGEEAMRNSRTAKEVEAVVAFKAFEEKLPASLASSEDWQHIKANWQRLRKEGLNWTMDDNFDAHTQLIEQLRQFEVVVADEYALTLDSEVDTYYLLDNTINKLPDTIEHIVQIRGYGTGILAKRQATEYQKIRLSAMIDELNNMLKLLRTNFEKTGRYHPAMQSSILAVSRSITDSAQQIVSIVASDILAGHFATLPNEFFGTATVAADRNYAQLYVSLLPMCEELIKERMSRAENMLHMSIGIAFLLFLVVIYFSIGICYAIISNIHSLARSAHAFAGGDMRERVKLGTHDELSQVGNSFNEMADGFSAMLEARREDEARLRATIDTAMDAVVKMNSEGLITSWNSQAEKIFGWPREEAIGRILHETIIPQQYREAHARGLKRFLLSGEGPFLNTRIETVGLHRDGHEFPVELSIAPIMVAGKYEFGGFIRDISKKRETDELIWRQANFDALTGLPNRHMFHDRLELEIRKASRANLKMALLSIDLDKFKEVNDTLGHSIGDTLLVNVTQRISSCTRAIDTVARLGGDEFTVLMTEIADISHVEQVTGNILRKLAEPYEVGNEVIYVSASIGITLYPDDATVAEDLLKNAEQAMYAAKDKGRNRFSYFTQSMQQAAQARLRLANELRSALAENQFMVYYQPIVDLNSGSVNKAEALIRWRHPGQGVVDPVKFIALAEDTGLIVEMGDWMFKESARQLKHWRALYNPALQLSVNMSPIQFRDAGSQGKPWVAYLQELDLPGQSMVIEITEGLLLDAEPRVAGKLLEFRNAGIQVSVDDFGTGYSSLSYLKKFHVDYLKIDQSFVRNLATDPSDMALSEAIIEMAHKLGITVVAEGVETEEQCKLLIVAGCDYAQGYLFSRPTSPEVFEELLQNGRPQLQVNRLMAGTRLKMNTAENPIAVEPGKERPYPTPVSSRLH